MTTPPTRDGSLLSDSDSLTNYIVNHYSNLFTDLEARAQRLWWIRAKAGPNPNSYWKSELLACQSDNPALNALLAEGPKAFHDKIRDRILAEHSDKIVLNRCPKCGTLARTPQACLCPACNHTWYELRRQSSAEG
jgi:hypothetical protein